MVATNTRARTVFGETHEGGQAAPARGAFSIGDKDQLIRHVSTCLLFENTYYESGNDIAENIRGLCAVLPLADIADVARRARNDLKLRHVPLFLAVQMARRAGGKIVADTIAEVVQRPDEMGEMISLYWSEVGDKRDKKGHSRLPSQMKKGLARVFQKFTPYQIAKWNEPKKVTLKDVLFLTHSKPLNDEQDGLWKALIQGNLKSPDTWEVALSSGKDKKETWARLISEKKLGYIALLMNLRNIAEAGVDEKIVNDALVSGAAHSRALPFRFVSAAKFAPQFAQSLSDSMVKAITGHLDGKTVVVVDVSGSMVQSPISPKSKLDRLDAAAALAVFFREACASVRVYGFTDRLVEVMNLRGLALHGALRGIPNGGTLLGQAMDKVKKRNPGADRIVVITDEQAHPNVAGGYSPADYRSAPLPKAWTKYAYLVNVAPYRPGLDTHEGWQRVNGWSERIVDWIAYSERGETMGSSESEPS